MVNEVLASYIYFVKKKKWFFAQKQKRHLFLIFIDVFFI